MENDGITDHIMMVMFISFHIIAGDIYMKRQHCTLRQQRLSAISRGVLGVNYFRVIIFGIFPTQVICCSFLCVLITVVVCAIFLSSLYLYDYI